MQIVIGSKGLLNSFNFISQDMEAEDKTDAATELKETPAPEQEESKQQPPADEGGLFKCSLCSFSERYHGHGASVPFARGINFSEDAYVMRDPFTTFAPNAFLFLGAPCSLCNLPVCVDCSIFYTKRFCSPCANHHLQQFPVEVQKRIRHMMAKKNAA